MRSSFVIESIPPLRVVLGCPRELTTSTDSIGEMVSNVDTQGRSINRSHRWAGQKRGSPWDRMLIFRVFYKLFWKRGTSNFPTCYSFLRKCTYFQNLCYHGTGSEERAREGVRGHQREWVCQSIVMCMIQATECNWSSSVNTGLGPPRGDPS